MKMVFLDESGYVANWKKGISAQPFYVLSAICIDSDKLKPSYDELREEISTFLPENGSKLGRGFEIKAKDIAKGSGQWGKDEETRNKIRDLMLSFPQNNDATAFVVVVDKQAHLDQYHYPDNPYHMSLLFLFERLEQYLVKKAGGDTAYCIYDHNTRLEAQISEQVTKLTSKGSSITYFSDFYKDTVSYTFGISHIIEMAVANSEHSIGLQIADYFATMTYQYYSKGKPSPCGWWDLLEQSLDKDYHGKIKGYGLKVFP